MPIQVNNFEVSFHEDINEYISNFIDIFGMSKYNVFLRLKLFSWTLKDEPKIYPNSLPAVSISLINPPPSN